MARKVTLYTAQWGDMTLEDICRQASAMHYDGLELACTPNHLDLSRLNEEYCAQIKATMAKYNLELYAISNHCVGQCVCDIIDKRHKAILPDYIWGDGDPEGVRQRAAQEMIKTGEAAKMLGVDTVIGFTGSSIWRWLYSFPSVSQEDLEEGYRDFAERFTPILDAYQKMGIKFALEAHPTEIAFDIASAQRAVAAVNHHPAFGFNFDPSHFAYQGVDYVGFIYRFSERIFHVHMKDVWWSDRPTEAGVFGGHTDFGDMKRYWNFRSIGHGRVDFEEIIRALNTINYQGPLSVEWEDNGMDRIHGATESLEYVKKFDFAPSNIAFDSSFEK